MKSGNPSGSQKRPKKMNLGKKALSLLMALSLVVMFPTAAFADPVAPSDDAVVYGNNVQTFEGPAFNFDFSAFNETINAVGGESEIVFSAEPAATSEANAGIEPTEEFIGIQPLATLTAGTWTELQAAIWNAQTGDVITLTNNITRTGDAITNDLSVIYNKSITIDGAGFTLDFRANGGGTSIARYGFALGYPSATAQQGGHFTLKNIVIRSDNLGSASLIGVLTNNTTAQFPATRSVYASNVGNGSGTSEVRAEKWIVTLEDVTHAAGSSPAAGLVVLPSGTVNLKGKIVWDCSDGSNPGNTVINARNIEVTGEDTDVLLANHKAANIVQGNATVMCVSNAGNTANTFKVTTGAEVHLRNYGIARTQVVYMQPMTNPARFTVEGAGSYLDIEGYGVGAGDDGAAVTMVASSGGYDISKGGHMKIHAKRPDGARSSGQPALVQNVAGGELRVDGEGSLMEIRADGAAHPWGAALRFRTSNDPKFYVTNLGKVEVIKGAHAGARDYVVNASTNGENRGTRATDTNNYIRPAAMRFGVDVKRPTFEVSTGGHFYVKNEGSPVTAWRNDNYTANSNDQYGIDDNGEVYYSATAGRFRGSSTGIEFMDSGFRFTIDGMKKTKDDIDKPSAVEIYAERGTAVAGDPNTQARTGGTIELKKDAVFVARGNVSNRGINDTLTAPNAYGIFSIYQGLKFDCIEPNYFDFANTNDQFKPVVIDPDTDKKIPNKYAQVFNVGSSGSSTYQSIFKVERTNFDVWGNAKNRTTVGLDGANSTNDDIDGTPYRAWTNLTFTLGGADFGTWIIQPPADVVADFGTRGMIPYRRASGNNARPIINELLQPTNADKYVRAVAIVPEGLNNPAFGGPGRSVWDGEVYGNFRHTPVSGAAVDTPAAWSYSFDEDHVYDVEKTTPIDGTIRLYNASNPGPKNGFLNPGDTYKLTAAWRGVTDNPNTPVGDRREATQDNIDKLNTVTVLDVLPPVPAVITAPTSAPNIPVGPGRTNTISGTSKTEVSQLTAEPHNPGAAVKIDVMLVKKGLTEAEAIPFDTATREATGDWTYKIPDSRVGELTIGDRLFFVQEDALGNRNPLVDTPNHDTTMLAAPYVIIIDSPIVIDSTPKIIGLNKAIDIANLSGSDRLKAVIGPDLLNASGRQVDPAYPSIDLTVAATGIDPAWGSPSDYEYRTNGKPDEAKLLALRTELTLSGKPYEVAMEIVANKDFNKLDTITVVPFAEANMFVAANDFSISIGQAQALIAKSNADRNREILERAGAMGRNSILDPYAANGNPSPIYVEVQEQDIKAIPADYPVKLRNPANPSEFITVICTVTDAPGPIITGLDPVEIWIGDAAKKPAGALSPGEFATLQQRLQPNVKAYHNAEVGAADITDKITVSGTVNEEKIGLYSVTYSVTNSELTSTTATRVVVVNDGTYTIGKEYIIKGQGFVKTREGANPADTAILADSKAAAYKIDQSAASGFTNATASVKSKPGGYVTNAAVGDYPIVLQVVEAMGSANPVEKTITAKVVDKQYIEDKEDPITGKRYIIGADSLLGPKKDLAPYIGMTDKAKLVSGLKAEAWVISDVATPTAVDAASNALDTEATLNSAAKGAEFPVVFFVVASGDIKVTAPLKVAGSEPVIDFSSEGNPLVIPKETASRILSADDIRDRMTVVDAEDPRSTIIVDDARNINQLKRDTTFTIDGSATKTIDASVAAVYSVTYTVVDNDGESATKTRAIVIDDGRFEIDRDNGFIISAKNYVMLQDNVQGTQDEVASQSMVKAYNLDKDGGSSNGTLIDSSQLTITNFAASGYGPKAAPKVYSFTWAVSGKPAGAKTKTITATIVNADVIFPPKENDMYTITANHFKVNVDEAQVMVSGDLNTLIRAANRSNVQVYPLVAGAPAVEAYTVNNGGFSTTQQTYNLTYGVRLFGGGSVISTTPPTQVNPTGTVSQGEIPVFTLATPINVWIGSGSAPAGSITAAAYASGGGDKYQVTVTDKEDTSLSVADATYTVTNAKTGAIVSGVDTATPGVYSIAYFVKDSDGNEGRLADGKTLATRAVVVNDGSFDVNKNILEANSFVTPSSEVNTDDLRADILAKSYAALYDGATGFKLSNAFIVRVEGNGYSATPSPAVTPPNPERYQIILADGPEGEPTTVKRTITGKVVDAGTIGPALPPAGTPVTRVWGTSLDMNRGDAMALAAGGPTAVLGASGLKTGAAKTNADASFENLTTKITLDADNFIARLTDANDQNDTGTFNFTVSDVNNAYSINLTIRVGAGPLPEIFATPNPWEVTATTTPGTVDVKTGVRTDDAEDGLTPEARLAATTVAILDVTNGGAGTSVASIPTNKVGVYKVTYTYTDADRNTATKQRAIVVNDGRYTLDDKSIIEAKSFVINSTKAISGSAAQILTETEAKAWNFDGSPTTARVEDSSTYQANPNPTGYRIQIMADGNTALKKTIYARVVNDTATVKPNYNENSDNGDKYAITANSFRMNATDAKALAAKSASEREATLLASAGVNLYDRTDNSFNIVPSLTKTLVSDGGFAAAAATMKDKDEFTLTIRCIEGTDAETTVTLYISDGLPPVIYTPKARVIWIGDPGDAERPAGSVLPANWDYITTDKSNSNTADDVYATDDRDGDTISSKLKAGTLNGTTFTEGTPINMTEVGFYEVAYAVTDSDYNTTYLTDIVVVTDGTIIFDGDYAVEAWDFIESLENAKANGAANSVIIGLTAAKAYRLDKVTDAATKITKSVLTPVNYLLDLKANGGYTATEGEYKPITVGIVGPEPGFTGDPRNNVVGKVLPEGYIIDDVFVDKDRYYVAAKNMNVEYADSINFTGLDANAKAKLIAESGALGFKVSGKTVSHPVDVVSNELTAATRARNADYAVEFIPQGVATAKAAVNLHIGTGEDPVIAFTEEPLVLKQTATSVPVTAADLKAKLTVTDAEDGANLHLTNAAGIIVTMPEGLNTQSLGVWPISYAYTDTDGNTGYAKRALIISDGRYEVEKDPSDSSKGVIIGARDFVIARTSLTGTMEEARSLSWAEAYDVLGNPIALTAANWTNTDNYRSGAEAGDYRMTWTVTSSGITESKTITAHVIDATVVDSGGKNSQYALVASNFQVNLEDAQAIINGGEAAYVTAAKAAVIKLVEKDADGVAVPTKEVRLNNSGAFKAQQSPNTETDWGGITFAIDGIPVSSQKAVIIGVVSQGKVPVLNVATPINVWIGEGPVPTSQPNAILPATYNNMLNVSVADEEDDANPLYGNAWLLNRVTPTEEAAKPLDLTTVGTYLVNYSVTDSDNNTVNTSRVVVVNDGRYTVGKSRILMANSFVAKVESVTSNSALKEAEIKLYSSATLIDAKTNAVVDASQITIPTTSQAGYGPIAGTYTPIVIAGKDFDPVTGNPVADITRNITGKVVDAEIIVVGPEDPKKDQYYVYGSNIKIRTGEAADILGNANPNAELLAAISGGGDKTVATGGLQNLTLAEGTLAIDKGSFAATQGTYDVKVTAVGSSPVVEKVFTVQVSDGEPPVILINNKLEKEGTDPLVIAYQKGSTTPLTRAQLLQGVTARDEEDGPFTDAQIIINPNASNVEVLPSISVGAAGVYQVTYKVIDRDGNPAIRERAVIIDDGSFKYDDKFVLKAKSFVVAQADVPAAGWEDFILGQSNAQAWTSKGASATAVVSEIGGFRAEAGTWTPVVAIAEYPSMTKQIDARVLGQDEKGVNGEMYSITAKDFRINIADAKALQAVSNQATYDNTFLTRSDVKSYLRADKLMQTGTPKLVSDGGFKTATFEPEGSPNYPSTFTVKYWVDEDHTAAIEVTVTVSNGEYPSIYLPAQRVIWIADPADPDRPAGSFLPSQWDYINGLNPTNKAENVSASDREDTTVTDIKWGTGTGTSFAQGNPIKMDEIGFYNVTYAATDSDKNTSYRTDMVIVTDGSIIFDGDYVIEAWSFFETEKNVRDNGSDDTAIKTLSAANAYYIDRVSDVTKVTLVPANEVLDVKDNGGFGPVEGEYDIVMGINPAAPKVGDPRVKLVGTVVSDEFIIDDIFEGKYRYYVLAQNAPLTYEESINYTGLDNSTKPRLITKAQAKGYKVSGNTVNHPVDVASNELTAASRKTGTSYNVVFIPQGVPAATAPVVFQIDNGKVPVITFNPDPLVLKQTAVSTTITDDALKAGVVAMDEEDKNISAKVKVIRPTGIEILDQRNVGVWQITYEVTDSDDNTVTAVRAVVVNDGRYIIDPAKNVIIGARDYVVARSVVSGTEDDAKARSYLEAYDIKGNTLPAGWTAAPAGYVANAEAKTYPITWQATGSGGTVTKSINATVVDADVIDDGGKNGQYAIVASNFKTNPTDAQAILNGRPNTFIAEAKAKVIKLVQTDADGKPLPDKAVELSTYGDFKTAIGIWGGITFKIQDIAVTAQKAAVTGTVSYGEWPEIKNAVPINIWVGEASKQQAGSILPAAYTGIKHGVTATDEEAKTTSNPTGDITASLIATADPSTGEVDFNKVGTYLVNFSVTDSDHNTTITSRVVVVNDGRFTVGKSRILRANSFVTQVANVNSNDLDGDIKTKSSAILIDAKTNAEIDASDIKIAENGYQKAVGVYPITVKGKDVDPANPSAELWLERPITGEVVEAPIVIVEPNDPNKDNYYLFGQNLELRIADAQEILDAADVQAAMLDAMLAGSRKASADGSLTPLTTIVTDWGGFAADRGTYRVTIADDGGNISRTFTVTVSEGPAPKIFFNGIEAPAKESETVKYNPASTDNATREMLMNGVTATDDPDGPLTDTIIINRGADGKENLPAIPLNKFSVTKISYYVVDSDRNEKEETRMFVVDDGSVTENNGYILRAGSFVMELADVEAYAASAHKSLILEKSGAEAWHVTGSEDFPATPDVLTLGGFKADPGDWKPVIVVKENPGANKEITARVLGAGIIGGNGDEYSIIGKPFRVNKDQAAALQAKAGTPAYSAEFVQRAGVQSYLRADGLNEAGSPALSQDGGFATATFLTEDDPNYPSTFTVRFWVNEDHTAFIDVPVEVSQGNYPNLDVPEFKQVDVGSVFNDAKYVEGVTYNDAEDKTADLRFTYDRPVSTVQEGVFVVTYNVTDTENNTTTRKGAVLVGDWIIEGDYAVKASNFFVTEKDLEGLTDDEKEALLLAVSHAEAIHLLRDEDGIVIGFEPAEVEVKELDASTPGTLKAVIGVKDVDKPVKTASGKVIQKDIISNTPDADGKVNDKNTSDPNDANRYIAAANNVTIPYDEAVRLAGKTDDATNRRLIALAEAVGYKILPTGTDSQHPVVVKENNIEAKNGEFTVTFAPSGVGGVEATVTFTVSKVLGPTIAFDGPLKYGQTDTPSFISREQLLAGVTVVDPEDPTVGLGDVVITDPKTGAFPVIDTSKPGLTVVDYSVTDKVTGEVHTAKRVVAVGQTDENQWFIMMASDYTIHRDNVPADEAGKKSQILTQTGATAIRKADYASVPVTVSNLGGYTNTRGEYPVGLTVVGDPARGEQNLNATRIATVIGEATTYPVNFHPNGGTLTGPSRILVQEPNFTLPYLPSSPVREGYTFQGWMTADQAPFGAGTKIDGETTVYAKWQANPVQPTPEPPKGDTYIYVNQPPVYVTTGSSRPVINVAATPSYEPVPEPETPEKEITPVEINPPLNPLGGGGIPAAGGWSLFNVLAMILSALLLLIFFVKFFTDRNDKEEEYKEKPIDQSKWLAMTPEQRTALLALREQERADWNSSHSSAKPKSTYVNLPVLAIVAFVFIEGLVILLATQNFFGSMELIDTWTLPLSAVILVQLIVPMVAAMVRNRNRSAAAARSRSYA